MIFSSEAFADGGFHETGEGGEHVDGWVDALVVKLSVDEDLALGDVACQVGNWMGDIYTATMSTCARLAQVFGDVPSLGIVRIGI